MVKPGLKDFFLFRVHTFCMILGHLSEWSDHYALKTDFLLLSLGVRYYQVAPSCSDSIAFIH